MTRWEKKGRCPKCCPDGGAYFGRTYAEGGWVWECRNCWHQIPVREVGRRPGRTPSQERALDAWLSKIQDRESLGPECPAEIHDLTVEEQEQSGTLSVFLRIRYPSLPDNALGNLYQTAYHFFIGRRGGVFSYATGSRKRVRYTFDARIRR